MTYDSRLSAEMNEYLDSIKDEFASEEEMKLILEKYDGFKNGYLAEWSITDEDKKWFEKLLMKETEIVHIKHEKVKSENERMNREIDEFLDRLDRNDFDDGIERIVPENKEKKGFLSKLFGKDE